jgi:microcystin-dependent protein
MTIARGEPMLAGDILNLAFFPQGTILMYDGTNWQDNVTLKGWYQCRGGRVNGLAIPDLQEKFIMGYAGGNRIGGENSKTLSVDNLPKHDHSGTVAGGAHQHAYLDRITSGGSVALTHSPGSLNRGEVHYYDDIRRTTESNEHSHTVTISNSGGSEPFDNRPSYYALIYVIKVAPAGSCEV